MAKFDPFLSLVCARVEALGRNPRKGRDQILPSGNLGSDAGGEVKLVNRECKRPSPRAYISRFQKFAHVMSSFVGVRFSPVIHLPQFVEIYADCSRELEIDEGPPLCSAVEVCAGLSIFLIARS